VPPHLEWKGPSIASKEGVNPFISQA
jgi:hypothetical protein